MTRRPWTSGRRAAAILICVGAAAVATGLLFDSVLDDADKFGSVVGAVVAVAGLVVQLRSARAPGAAAATDGATALPDRLAERLRDDWQQEWRRRRLHDPGPMPVAWVNADELADHPHTVTGSADRNRPIPVLDGTFTDFTETILGLPSRRLVVIGPSGQGKSSLCLHLARELLEQRPDGRLPLLVGFSGWQPDTTDLDRWLADTLTTDVAPALGSDSGDGRSWAERLVAEKRFVPLLDGLDELPEELRGRAIERINDADLGPLLLTCRAQEYSVTVRALRDVVSAAAVVRLVPLGLTPVAVLLAGMQPTQLAISGLLLALLVISAVAAAIGLSLALAFGLPLAAVDAFTTPVDIGQAVQPRSLAGTDRTVSLVRGSTFGLVVGATLFPSALYLLYGIALSMRSSIPGAAGTSLAKPVPTLTVESMASVAVPAALAFLLTSTAWGQFAFARIYLTVTRHFPFALLALLDEARDRGVLRQSGAAYLFRHERLQTHLTEAAAATTLSRRRVRPAARGSARRRRA